MRVVIVGAGAVGSYLAMRLSGEGQDVVVVESDPGRAADLQERLDVLVLTGNGASPAVLRKAGSDLAELLIAVSNSDGVNALACHVARALDVPRTIARIEDPDLRDGIDDLGIDVIIDPEEMAAREVLTLVRQRGVSDLIEFAEGRLLLLGGIVRQGSPLLGRSLAELRAEHTDLDWAVAAIVRHGDTLVVRGATTIREFDHVLIMVRRRDLEGARALLGLVRGDIERVFVTGATRLADLAVDLMLDQGLEVVAIDRDRARCHQLADRHPKALVILGDPTDPTVLSDLGPAPTDAVAALSGWDDANLTSCLVGKALGASTAVARFHRPSYVRLLIGSGLDASVSSRLAAANAILRFVRRGRIHSVSTFKDTQAEALDIEVEAGSAADGAVLAELDVPAGTVIGGVARGDNVIVPRGDTAFEAGDRLIVFSPPEAIHDVEALCTT